MRKNAACPLFFFNLFIYFSQNIICTSVMFHLNLFSALSQVFHGADSDMEWLQRDLGLYVVRLFDTHQASRALNLARHSLDHLLVHFCNVASDKRFQLADWRVR